MSKILEISLPMHGMAILCRWTVRLMIRRSWRRSFIKRLRERQTATRAVAQPHLLAIRSAVVWPDLPALCMAKRPPYSPDFNPIKMAFSKLKAILRKTAARTLRQLWNVIGKAINQFKPDERKNYFPAAGYDFD